MGRTTLEPKEIDISFPRGDTCPYSFTITDSQKNILDFTGSELYFTLKESSSKQNYILQKRYTRGEITINGKDGHLVLEHDDTAELKVKTQYFYDIEIKSGDYVATLVIGHIELTEESTWKANE